MYFARHKSQINRFLFIQRQKNHPPAIMNFYDLLCAVDE